MGQPYPELTSTDLSGFSGRPTLAYPPFTDAAIQQATLLFKMATCLAALPDDPTQYQLALYGIISMADHFVLSQPYVQALASPFNSETIGSYSFSKTTARAAVAVKTNEDTGVMWFDLAVERLGVCDVNENIPLWGGTQIFEQDGILIESNNGNDRRLLGPQQEHDFGILSGTGYSVEGLTDYPGQPVGD